MRISSLMLWRCAGQAAVLTNPFDRCEPTRCNALVAGRRSDASIARVRASDHQRAHRRPWSSSWTPSARAVTNLSVPAEELGAPRQAEQPAACGWAGFLGLSGSGRMPCVPCVLPRSRTLCSMLVCRCGRRLPLHCVCRRTVSSLCLLCAIGRVLARLCRSVHGLFGSVAGPCRGGAGTVLFGRVG